MLEVGTSPYPDSKTSGVKILIFEYLYKLESLFDTMPIRKILLSLENFIKFFNSSVFPELLIRIKISWLVIFPRSPCAQSFGEIEKDGTPTDDSVAEIFDAIIPLFPTPHIITLDLHFKMTLTASLKDLLIDFLSFLSALISKSITLFPISEISF